MSVSVEHARHDWKVMKHELLQSFPDLAEDETALFDTLDGMTDLTDQIAELIRSADMDKRFCEAIKLKIQDLNERSSRLMHRADKKRAVCLQAMAEDDIKKIEVFDMTISRRRVAPKVMVIDREIIPQDFIEAVLVQKVLKADVKAALAAGVEVPGAVLSNASETLSVRTK